MTHGDDKRQNEEPVIDYPRYNNPTFRPDVAEQVVLEDSTKQYVYKDNQYNT